MNSPHYIDLRKNSNTPIDELLFFRKMLSVNLMGLSESRKTAFAARQVDAKRTQAKAVFCVHKAVAKGGRILPFERTTPAGTMKNPASLPVPAFFRNFNTNNRKDLRMSAMIDDRFLKIEMSDGKTVFQRRSEIYSVVFNAENGSLVLYGKKEKFIGSYCNVVNFRETNDIYFSTTETPTNPDSNIMPLYPSSKAQD